MTHTLRESFGNIGRAIADEYRNHGKARGISLELVNGVFDFGDKVADTVKAYAPQAADTAYEKGATIADSARRHGEKLADASRTCFTKVSEDIRKDVRDRNQDQGKTGNADDADAATDDDADAGTYGSGATVQDDGDDASSKSRRENMNAAIRKIDEQIQSISDDRNRIKDEIDSLTHNNPDMTDEESKRVDELVAKDARLKGNLDYLEESRRTFAASIINEPEE